MDFDGMKLAAADIPSAGERGLYTADMFQQDFPQFGHADGGTPLLPGHMLQMFVGNANASVLPSRWGDGWRYAAGLYVAHFAAMYLRTYSDGSVDAGAAAMKGQPLGAVKSAQMGDTRVDYDNTAVTAGMEKWGAWNATQYGQQLVTQARFVGLGGMYAI